MSAPEGCIYCKLKDVKACTKRVRLNPCKAFYSEQGFLFWDGEIVHVLL